MNSENWKSRLDLNEKQDQIAELINSTKLDILDNLKKPLFENTNSKITPNDGTWKNIFK